MKAFDISKAPLEIERKFLIAFPDLNVLSEQDEYHMVRIEQTYLERKDGIKGGRIRKMTDNGSIRYVYTYKEKISELTRHEFEEDISEKEYNKLMKLRSPNSSTIHKDRHMFLFHGLKYELDIYDFWDDRATLEAEVSSEDTPIPIPPFLTLIKEVSFDKRYHNSHLAVNHGVIDEV